MSRIKPHNLLFLFGFIYYLVTPLFIGYFRLMQDKPGMEKWHLDFLNAMQKMDGYIVIIISYFISFYLGSFFTKILPRERVSLKNNGVKVSIKIITFFGYIFWLVIIFFAFAYREILFTGYATYERSLLSALTTINSVSLILFFYIFFTKHFLFRNIYLMNITVSSILLLGLGSRMYVLIPIISLIVYKFFYSKRKWNLKIVLLFSSLVLLFLLVIGTWRIGASISLDSLIYFLFAEPIFTWWSAATFLGNNELSIIEIPTNFFTSFFSFLPSFVFPNKSDLIISIRDTHYYEAPLGADSVFVSIQGNFGWFFGPVFMFFCGLFYSLIEYLSHKSNFMRAYYLGIVSVLPFQFFRDNFGIVNKQIFWNMFTVPLLLLSISVFIIESLKNKPKRSLVEDNLR